VLPALLSTLAVVWLALLGPQLSATSASAASDRTAAPVTATVGECLAGGDVWLYVSADDGTVLRSECVGRPSNGLQALTKAGARSTQSKGGYVCTLAGYPAQCPRRYNGQFWQYWHASGAGEGWTFSDRGAGEYRPEPGSIEGWCYNSPGTRRCALPTIAAEDRAVERIDRATTSESTGTPAVAVGLAGVVVVALAAVVLNRRRARSAEDASTSSSP
jgi:hypothetical protein